MVIVMGCMCAGVQYSQVVCVEREAGVVDDIHCNKSIKPDDMQRSCNEYICPARYVVQQQILVITGR